TFNSSSGHFTHIAGVGDVRSTDFDDEAVEQDKKNREILKAPKARDVVRCAECRKPRVVYSPSKTDIEQDALLRRMKEENL
ncbi:hypothetical protein MAR_004958, partial [Mya arenaria]